MFENHVSPVCANFFVFQNAKFISVTYIQCSCSKSGVYKQICVYQNVCVSFCVLTQLYCLFLSILKLIIYEPASVSDMHNRLLSMPAKHCDLEHILHVLLHV